MSHAVHDIRSDGKSVGVIPYSAFPRRYGRDGRHGARLFLIVTLIIRLIYIKATSIIQRQTIRPSLPPNWNVAALKTLSPCFELRQAMWSIVLRIDPSLHRKRNGPSTFVSCRGVVRPSFPLCLGISPGAFPSLHPCSLLLGTTPGVCCCKSLLCRSEMPMGPQKRPVTIKCSTHARLYACTVSHLPPMRTKKILNTAESMSKQHG
jgi:hypothetical protein